MEQNTEKPKKKTGPKPKTKEEKRTERITILVKSSFKKEIEAAADKNQQTTSGFIISAIKEKMNSRK